MHRSVLDSTIEILYWMRAVVVDDQVDIALLAVSVVRYPLLSRFLGCEGGAEINNHRPTPVPSGPSCWAALDDPDSLRALAIIVP